MQAVLGSMGEDVRTLSRLPRRHRPASPPPGRAAARPTRAAWARLHRNLPPRILCSKRCLCSASTTELSHSRRKVGCSPERSGSLRGDEGVAGLTERRACSARVPAMVAVPPQCTSPPWATWGMKAPPTPREGATGNSPAVAGQALARQVQSRALGPQWRPAVKVR